MYRVDAKRKMREVYDDCSQSTALYNYLVRIRIGATSPTFQKENSAVMIDFIDTQERFITRVSISPSWLKSDVYNLQQDRIRLRTLKFILNRATPIPQVGAIRICHDSYYPVGSYIFVHSVDVRDVRDTITTSITVLKRIYILPPNANESDQVFKAKYTYQLATDDDAWIGGFSPFLTIPEYISFLFLYSNLVMLFSMFYPDYFKIKDWKNSILNGTVAFAISAMTTSITIAFYRLVIKHHFSLNRGLGKWRVFKVIYLSVANVAAAFCGITAALLQSRFGDTNLTYWSLANIFATVVLLFVLVPIYVLLKYVQKKTDHSTGNMLLGRPETTFDERTHLKKKLEEKVAVKPSS